jgi:hypothetical protein
MSTNTKEYQREWEAKNKDKRRIINKRRRLKLREMLRQAKASGCIECGENHPACVEFHHREDEDKLFEIGDAVRRGVSEARLFAEIAKCDMLCANCHRKRHW